MAEKTAARPVKPAEPTTEALRLRRIADAHTPDEWSGAMCRECGYLDPCPTRRTAQGATALSAPWRAGQVISGAVVGA